MELTDLKPTGLTQASVVRIKLFTLDERFVLRKAGRLREADRAAGQRNLRLLLPVGG